jgi:hypothetical protein
MSCCCGTNPFHHTGTTSPTDIGPSTGGKIQSITISPAGSGGQFVFKDGGSSGTVILSLFRNPSDVDQFFFKGLKIAGQLNITLPEIGAHVTVEMSE